MNIKKLLYILFICIMFIASCNNKINDPTQNTGGNDSGNNDSGNDNENNDNNGQIEPTVININLGEKIDDATLTEKFNNSKNQYNKYQLTIVGDVTAEDLKTLHIFLYNKYLKGEYTLPLILDFKKANFENNTISDFGDYSYGSYLEKITFPDTLRTIGKNVLPSVQKLKELNLPDSLISIGDLSFSDIASLERLIIPDSVMSIGNDVFVRSYLMKELKLPKSLRTIGRSSISLSSSSQFVALDEINLPNLTYVDSGSFLNVRTKKLVLPETLIYVGSMAFNVSTSDTELRIPKSLKRIEELSFYYHKTLYLYDTIEYINMSSKGTETVVYYGTEPKTISGSGLWMSGGIARLYLPNVKEGDPNADPALWETFLLDKNSIYKFYPQYIYFGTEPAQN
ncbi:leucine-rich repeat domain-containing protein [Brachyspira innocens]|uniref:leucine-rich repeat domain-containing protein n=1 Tax=Brachyspira innocens TaxID=13264 RepID=UPI0026F2E6BC|nr:leucine-rich repeat domain-containing protein [Brachyspira innocens]